MAYWNKLFLVTSLIALFLELFISGTELKFKFCIISIDLGRVLGSYECNAGLLTDMCIFVSDCDLVGDSSEQKRKN